MEGDLVDTVQPIALPCEVLQIVVQAHHAPLMPGLEKPLPPLGSPSV